MGIIINQIKDPESVMVKTDIRQNILFTNFLLARYRDMAGYNHPSIFIN